MQTSAQMRLCNERHHREKKNSLRITSANKNRRGDSLLDAQRPGRHRGLPLRYFFLCTLIITIFRGISFGEPPPPSYHQLRYDEDYAYLRDPARRTDVWDPIKYIRLDEKGDWHLSLGGEMRLRYEYFHNPEWGEEPHDDNGYLLQRYMAHAGLHMGERVRFFGQLKSGLESGRNGGPRPTDEDRLDIHQAFLDVKSRFDTDDSLLFRLGRQELAYGSSRLISVRESPNVRQSFDGVKCIAGSDSFHIDAFLTRPVRTNRGAFDDSTDTERTFWGLYSGYTPTPSQEKGIDVYYLGLNRDGARFDQGTAYEVRHSLGTRIWGGVKEWDYNFEFVYQWGGFGAGTIQAWTAASDTSYTLHTFPLTPRIGLKANIASGDEDPDDPDLQTFNPLFPRGNYFAETSLIGPANFFDIHPSVDLHIAEGMTLTADWDFFWRESVHDGIYGNAVNLVRSGRESQARYIGSQLSTQIEWEIGRHITVLSNYAHFFAGPFLKKTKPGKDVDFFTLWVTYKF